MPNIVTILGESGNEAEIDLDLATEGVLERIESGAITVLTPQTDEPDGELVGLSKAELVALAEERGLDASGTKADLIERIGSEPTGEDTGPEGE